MRNASLQFLTAMCFIAGDIDEMFERPLYSCACVNPGSPPSVVRLHKKFSMGTQSCVTPPIENIQRAYSY